MPGRLLVLLVALALAGCASTSHYHEGDADYWYGAPYSYVERPVAHTSMSCWYGSGNCYIADWEWLGSWGYGGWPGWGYADPWYGYYGSRWHGSLWLGFGSWATWGYPGWYNPWFGAWSPYPIVYRYRPRTLVRDTRSLRRDQALQASWRQRARTGTSAGISAATRVRPGVVERHDRIAPGSALGARRPAGARTPAADASAYPRGRPAADEGIPVNWPVQRAQPVRSVPRPAATTPDAPATAPRGRPERGATAPELVPRSQPVPVQPRARPRPETRPPAAATVVPRVTPRSSAPARAPARTAPRAAPRPVTPAPRPASPAPATSAPSRSSSGKSPRAAPRGRPQR